MQRYIQLLLLPLVLIAGCGNPDTSAAARTPAEISAPDLQAAVADADVRSFYEKHGWQAVWSTSSAEQLEHALSSRDNRNTLGLVDFSEHSSVERFSVVDVLNGRVSQTYLFAHGRGSDLGHTGGLTSFSNRPGSNATSQGSFLVANA